MRPEHLLLASLALLAAACVAPLVDDPAPTGEGDGSTHASADDATTTPPPPPPPGTTDPEPGTTTSGLDTDATSTAASSTGHDGPGLGEECELHVQDCAPGLKCMPYSTDGSTWWNAVACFPVVPDPADLGEPCQWEGEPWSGYDDCDVGQVCWTFEDAPGVCKGVCRTDDPDNWDESTYTCEDPLATPHTGCQECFCTCEVPCDPLGQNCDEGQECVGVGDWFSCAPDASGDMGAYGDECEYLNVCDPGLACLDASAVPGCEGVGCCSPFCDVTEPNTCPGAAEGQECQPWFQRGEALPGFENVGACALPQ
jgi:hypothetical protein